MSGCDGPNPPSEPSETLSYSHSGVPWLFDDDGYQYLIDTGTPRTFVVPPVAGLDPDTFVVESLDAWNVQGLSSPTDVVITYELPPAVLPMIGPDFGGILGADTLARRPFLMDPRKSRVVLDDDGDFTEWLRDIDEIVDVPFQLEGGGTSCMTEGHCFEHDGLRVLVDVLIEGEPTIALLDTGSTYTAMGSALFDRLERAGGHPQVAVSRLWDTWEFARLRTLSVGEAHLENVPVRVDPGLDPALARLRVETGQKVELLLGHSVLLYFAMGLDYDDQTLTLAKYPEQAAVETEMFRNFGLWLTPADEGCMIVGALARGSQAESEGIELGDCIVAVADMQVQADNEHQINVSMEAAPMGDAVEFAVVSPPSAGERQPSESPTPRVVRLEKKDLLPNF